MTGVVSLSEGYNADIQLSETSNTIQIGAAVGAGAGEPCQRPVPDEADPLEAFSSQSSSSGSSSEEAVPLPAAECDEVVNTINGVRPTLDGGFQLTGGAGITVENEVDNNTVRIIFGTGDNRPFCGGSS